MKKRTAQIIASLVMGCVILNGCSGGGVDLSSNSEATAEAKNGFSGIVEIKDNDGNILITTDDLLSVDTISEKDKNGTYGIELKLTEDGAKKFKDATQDNLGGGLGFYVNGTLVSSPRVNSIIVNGEIQITGFDELLDAYSIVSAIKNGGEVQAENPKPEDGEQEPEETEEPEKTTETNKPQEKPKKTEKPQEVPHRDGMYGVSDKDIHEVDATFSRNDVRNDVTGKWKISTIAADVQMEEYAASYYKWLFRNDDEIHAIVNFTYKTTTQIKCVGDNLYVTVFDYVDGEEHDAKLLFSGTVIGEYIVYTDNGDIEKIED